MRTTLLAISAGGIIGALSRYALSLAMPTIPGHFPWATFSVNVTGCFLIGVLMTWLSATTAPAWVRPLLGVGVLGGYTTFSTYAVDVVTLVHGGDGMLAVVYLISTLVAAMIMVYLATVITRLVVKR